MRKPESEYYGVTHTAVVVFSILAIALAALQ